MPPALAHPIATQMWVTIRCPFGGETASDQVCRNGVTQSSGPGADISRRERLASHVNVLRALAWPQAQQCVEEKLIEEWLGNQAPAPAPTRRGPARSRNRTLPRRGLQPDLRTFSTTELRQLQ